RQAGTTDSARLSQGRSREEYRGHLKLSRERGTSISEEALSLHLPLDWFPDVRDPVWKYLQTVQYGVHGNFPRLSYPTFFPRFEFQDIIPPDDFLTSDEELDSVLFGTLRGHVVGLRYYTGVVNNNEMVALQREPDNPYDKNAIKVNNVNGNQVGHIKKDLAAALAYIMDNKLAQVEGSSSFSDIESKLSLKTEFDKLFEDLKEDDKTQEMEPAEAIETPLLPHQKQALAWMVSRENSKELPPFWEQRSDLYYNTITNFSEKDRPENVHGGILADDMGLGKTLTAIAVILTNFHDGKSLPIERIKKNQLKKECNVYDESMKLGGNNTSEKADGLIKDKVKNTQSETKIREKGASAVESSKKTDTEERPRTTLIICPLSVLSNWIDQFGQHIKSDVHLNFYVYYGPDRVRDPALLSKQDIVLTTYNILTHDYGTKADSPLHSIRWLRVILDEGHAIRNPNAQQTKAVLDLEAERRWVLTGTPIQNSLKDLWSLLSFLKLKPFLDREWWHRTIQRPVTMGDEGGLRYFNEGTVLAHYADVLGLLLRLRQICCHTHLLTNAVSSCGPSGNDTPEELRKKLIRKMKLILSSGSDEECAICLDSLTVPVITHCAHVFCKPCICQVIQNEQPHAKCPLCRNDIHGDNLLECPPEELACDTEKKPNMEWTSSSKINALMHALIDLRKKNPNIKSLVVSQFTTFLSLIETPLRASGFVFTRLDGSMAQKKRVESIQCFQNTEAGSPTIMLLSLKAGGVGLNLSAASRVFLMDPVSSFVDFLVCYYFFKKIKIKTKNYLLLIKLIASFITTYENGSYQFYIIIKPGIQLLKISALTDAIDLARSKKLLSRKSFLEQKALPSNFKNESPVNYFIVKDSVEENMLKIQNTKRELAAGAFGTKKTDASEMKQAKINEIRTLIDL
ncbi:hypothetical protein E2I00_007445, partial [Balaenoptera physalus]